MSLKDPYVSLSPRPPKIHPCILPYISYILHIPHNVSLYDPHRTLSDPPFALKTHVPHNQILTQNLYYVFYYPNPKYLKFGYMDLLGYILWSFSSHALTCLGLLEHHLRAKGFLTFRGFSSPSVDTGVIGVIYG